MFNQLSQYTRYRYSLTIGTIVIALSGSMVHAALPGDLTIYRKGTAGQVTLVMMLDNSGSMASSSLTEDYGLASNCTLSNDTATTSAPSYTPKYCPVSRSTYSALSAANKVRVTNGCIATGNTATANSTIIYKCSTRIYRVQAGMYAALDDATVSDDAVMGVGTFNDKNSGKILYPAAALGAVVTGGTGTTGQRYQLKNAINNAFAGGSTIGATPTAPAYAEAAAYLLGTTTTNNIPLTYSKDVYRRRNTTGGAYSMCSTLNSAPTLNVANNGAVSVNDQTCNTWSSTTTTTQYPNSGATAYDGTYTQTISNVSYVIYYKNIVGSYADPDSGFANSIASSKSGSNYISPLPTNANRASCDGQGIYFLTDGEPNGPANDQFNVMKAALGSFGSTFSCGTSPITPASSILSNSGAVNNYPAWDCIGTFANALYGNTTTRADGTKFGDGATNPKYSSTATITGASIQTALVGFGSVFEDLTNTDPGNACDWGARAGGPGSELNCSTSYGGGGFYQAGSATDVTRSIKKFLEDLTQKDITPLVTGAAAVPVDGVDPDGFQPYAYMRVLTPNPASTSALIWDGNLKKYNVASGTLKSASPLATILNDDGTFVMNTSSTPAVASTTDLWNSTGVADGGITLKGGAFSKVTMPTSGVSPRTLRPLWTNYNSTGDGELSPSFSSSCITAVPYSCGSGMLRIPAAPSVAGESWIDSYVTTKFNATPLSNIAMSTRLTLLNYLGYVQPLSPLPSTVPALAAPTAKANFATGGIIHSLPVQVTYSANINSDGTLADPRTSSVLYGTMEGALHLVAAGNTSGSTSTDTAGGVEQMVFVPKEILDQSVASQALIYSGTGVTPTLTAVAPQTDVIDTVPTQGVDGPWVADTAYKVDRTDTANLKLKASKVNVYGGLRMGGSSFYGLNILDATAPKLLFRIGADRSGLGFDRMGQSWSKPVLANIRYNGAIKRVMIVGGGYDVCYESPLFALSSTSTSLKSGCRSKTKAAGNAVYMVDATTGDLIWEATDSSASIVGGLPSTARATYNTNLVHSVVMRISTLDRNADGLIDHLYFGDLGGQIFRADFDNASQRTASNQGRFGVRVVRLADLRNTTTPANSPRFYVAPTVTIHDEGANTFIMLGIGSGDRSSPLDVLPLADGGKNPIVAGGAAVTKPVNNVYGIIDRDFINTQLISVPAVPPSTTTTVLADTSLVSKDITLSSLQINPQLLSTSTKKIPDYFFGTGKKEGWYRSLSSQSTGVELTGRTAGGMKAFEEEALAITGTLIMPVYDPQGVATPQASPCSAKVVGETIRETFCIPYGACLNSDGTVNSTNERNTGLVINTLDDHPTLMGNGIRGVAFGKKDGGGLTILGNTSGTGGWSTNRRLVPTLWYEKQPNPNKVQ